MKVIELKDFSLYPGLRSEKLGPDSGERFRDEVLIPALREGGEITVILDGVISAPGSSFLDEAFAGLIRCGISARDVKRIRIISERDPPLVREIAEYIDDAIEATK